MQDDAGTVVDPVWNWQIWQGHYWHSVLRNLCNRFETVETMTFQFTLQMTLYQRRRLPALQNEVVGDGPFIGWGKVIKLW